jgi:hypothetical protein
MERGNYHIQAYLSIAPHKGHEIVCIMGFFFLKKKEEVDLTLELAPKTPSLFSRGHLK